MFANDFGIRTNDTVLFEGAEYNVTGMFVTTDDGGVSDYYICHLQPLFAYVFDYYLGVEAHKLTVIPQESDYRTGWIEDQVRSGRKRDYSGDN